MDYSKKIIRNVNILFSAPILLQHFSTVTSAIFTKEKIFKASLRNKSTDSTTLEIEKNCVRVLRKLLEWLFRKKNPGILSEIPSKRFPEIPLRISLGSVL